jgi:DNA (cytosine-5)-methyltransferase 1
MNKIKTLSLFSGSGGLDLGFIKTGFFDILCANDIDQKACETYNNNIANHSICCDIKNFNNISSDVDVVIGGPPCQGFCSANPNRFVDDPRNLLFKEYKKQLDSCNPKMFVFENVPGILTIDKGILFKTIVTQLSYNYNVVYQILNSADYGTPQLRKRVIIVGCRKDLCLQYQFPVATVKKYRTVGDVFSIPHIKNDPNHKIGKLTELNIKRLRHIPPGGSMKDCPPDLRNNTDYRRSMRRLDLNKPSYTIVHNNCDHFYHPTETRRITIREMARLQDYPDSFIFCGNKSQQSQQVGNSVPVNLAYNLALSIATSLRNL